MNDAHLTEEDAELVELEEDPKGFTPQPVELARVSKHRAGRTPKMTKGDRRQRDRVLRMATQKRKKLFLEHQADLRALQEALRD